MAGSGREEPSPPSANTLSGGRQRKHTAQPAGTPSNNQSSLYFHFLIDLFFILICVCDHAVSHVLKANTFKR
jgi:hypothetical protein